MSKASKDIQQQSKLILEELEERRLFSGGIEGLIDPSLDSDANAIYSDINGSQAQTDNTSADAAVAEQQSQEIVFVDAGVDNHQQLVDDLLANSDSSRNIEVVVLDQDKDGIEAISEFLAGRDDLDAVHIISHGSDGSVELGNTSLNSETLEDNNLKIALWANSFAETGDILIYGCNLAETEAGQSLINDISSLTLTDVAASSDLTGHESLGGDWQLELNVGTIETQVAVSTEVQQQWQAVLAVDAEEAFTGYPPGDLDGNGGGTGFTGTWSYSAPFSPTPNQLQVVTTGLTHPTSGPDTTDAVVLNQTGLFDTFYSRTLASPYGSVDETIWASFLIQPQEQAGNLSYMGVVLGSGGYVNTNQLFFGYEDTTFKMNDWSGGGTAHVDATAAVLGETAFLVLRLDISSSGNDTATLFVNPNSGEPTPSVSGTTQKVDLDLTNLDTITIVGGAVTANPTLMGGLRIGSSFADVAPAGSNSAPVAVADAVNTDEDTAVLIDVLANDSDPDTDPLTARMVTGPTNGTLVPSPVELINETNLTNDGANDREADWSPDGSQIVFRSDRGTDNNIWVMDADGTGLTQLTFDTGFDSRPVWSPDGTQILFTSDRSGDDDIWIMNANGSGQTNLTNNALGDDTAATWSPDGSQIVFKSNRDSNDEIYVMNADGSGQINITNDAAKDSGPSWSPDGTKLLFVSDRGANTDVWIMDTDGSNLINLTNSPTSIDSNASWSADGSKIVFKSDRDGGNTEIYVMDANGASPTRLTDNAFVDGAPSWSPDGSQVIYQTNRVGNHEIYVADISSDGNFTYTPDAGFTGVDSFTYVANDGALDSAVTTVTITVDPVNDAPTFGTLDGNPTFIENGSPVVLDSDVTIYDVELSAADNFDGATLTLQRNGGADAEDVFSATGTLAALTEGGDLDVGGTIIGTVTTNSAGALVLTFNANATNALVDSAMQQIAYSNSSNAPPASIQIDWTFDDGNSGAQGTGGALQAIGNTTVNITAVNDAPTFIDGAFGNWNFDEGSGDSVAEGAIGISTATLGSTTGADANDPTWTTGMFGQALQFDGVDDYVEVADAPGIDISGPEFSASLWVKPDRGPGTEDMFFMKGDRQGTGNVNYYLSWKDSGKMTWAFKSDGGFEYIDMDVTLPTVDEWNHIAVVFDRPTVSIYINGTEYTSSVATGGTMDKDLVANDDPLWIGAGRDGGSLVTAGNFSAPFSGAIDELALFDRALTAAEVEAIRTSAPPVVTASEFTVDENSANNTVVGTVVANDPDVGDTLSYTITAGNTNGAFAIDNNGIITVANSTALNFETTPSFNLTIQATDDGSPNLSDTTTVTIDLNDVVELLVSNTNATGTGSLYEAILNANANDGITDTITFDIPGAGPHVINLTGALPAITDTVIINGSSEPDYAGAPVVVLDGSAAGAVDGLTLAAGSDGSTIRGLVINNFQGHGILITNSSGNTIAGNYIGTDSTGLVDQGNGLGGFAGLMVTNGASNNTIGGLTAADRNVISGNGDDQIKLFATAGSGNTIIGNYIGLDAAGNATLGNNGSGIDVQADGNTIGGTTAEERNVIADAQYNGIVVSGDNNIIQGNYIGTDKDGNATIDTRNGKNGVWIYGATGGGNNNLVGGTEAGAGNLIHGNAWNGVMVSGGTPTGNTILGNTIYGNDLLGIDLNTTNNGDGVVTDNDPNDTDSGLPNDLQNFPALTQADLIGTNLTLSGSLDTDGANTQYRIEFYGNAAGTNDAPNGEGRHYLGSVTVTTNGSGDASFSNVMLSGVTLAGGDYVTATATRITDPGQVGVDDQQAYGNTSEFAVNHVISDVDTPATITGDVSFSGNEGDAVAGDLNATDVNGLTDTTYFTVTTQASNGTAAIDAETGAWTFTPTDPNWFGSDSFTVTVTDDLGGTTTQVVSITLANVNDPPVISIDPSPILYLSGTMAVDPNLTVSDVDNATLQSAQVSFGDGYLRGQDRLLFTDQLGITGSFDLNTGILTLTGSASVADYETALRSVQYEDFNPTPAEGILYVNFSVSDGTDTSLVDTRVLEIVDNLPPRAADDFGTAAEGGSVVIDVAANDTDSDDALDLTSIVITSGPANGSVVVNGDGTVTYTHDGSETASDSFTYTIRDTDGNLSNEAPVSITVTAVNDAPVAASDSYSVNEDATLDVDWFDTNWTARQTLTFDNSGQGETLVDFPVLVVLDSGNIDYGKTQDNGEDLRFFAADGEPLDYDIEEWNEGGTSYVWVKVPQMTAGSNTDTITMYYGNATAAAGEDAEAAWSNGFLGVHHLNDDLQDASGNDNDGVNSGSATAAGQVADGQLFDGVDDAISLGDDASLQNIFHDGGTVSAWIYPTDWGENGYGRIFDKSGGTLPSNTGWALELYEGQDALLFQVGFDGTMGQWYTDSNSISLNQWTHVSLTYDASNTSNLPEIYINGVLQSLAGPGQSTQPTGTVGSDAGYDLTVGNHAAATSRTFDGVIDDVRISSESRSADWVRAQHLTTSNAFVTFGGEETAPAQGGLLGNDTDAENDALTVSLVSGPSNEAAFTLYKNGTFSYTPNPDFNGVDSFTYRVNDGNSDSNTVTVTLNVVAQDDPATITGDTSFSGDEGDAVAGDLDATDVDGLADGTYFSVTTQATSGTAAIDIVTGAWTYTPADPNWFGSDSFTVTVTDDLGGTTTQVVSITLANVNDPVTAVDDSYSVSEDATFSSSSEWSDSNWSYSRTLSFDNSTRTENLVDFPVLVKLDSSVIDYAKTHDQGWDLRFFDQDGTALAHEVELWDEAGTSYVWVKIPQIDASSDTDSIVMYYGNAGVADSGENAAGVWSDYRAAYHLNENPGATGTLADAAGNFDAVNAGSTDTAGIIGNAQDFNGVDQSINLGDDRNWINNASGATLSIWMNADTTTGSGDLIGLTRNDPADTGASRITLIRNGDDIMLIARTMDDSSDSVSVSTTTNPLSAGSWHHITGTVDYASDVDNIKIYVDGELEGTFSHNFTLDAIPNTDSSHAMIGADEDGVSAFFDGQLDEARVADQQRSADWVSAQYAAMTGTLVDIGAEQTVQGVLINDVDADRDVLTVTELNGAPAAIGVATPLSPSGAIVTLNADGSFTYDTNGAFESLGAGDSTTDSFTYTVIDGNGGVDTATVTMTITGVDDTPTIGGTDTGAVQEDVAVVSNNISTTGTLTITDPDTGESTFQAETVTGTYGDLTIDTAGNWTYTADNTQAAIQQLDVSESLTDTLTVTSFDGTTHNVVITINGSEDAAVISGTTTGSVTEDGTLTSSGALTISDTDTSDTPSFADVGVTAGDNGYGTFEMTAGTWTYTLDNNDPAVQALDAGETLTDTHTFTATDGSTQQVTITINGAEDAPVIGGVATGTVAEDGTLTASDTLTITDADTSDNPISFNNVAATLGDNGYGDFEITSNTWTYTLNNGHAAVQALDAGQTLTDTYAFTASDGSTQTVTVTINGAEDAPVIGGVATGTVAEDGTLTASDTLTITDADTSDNPISFNDVAATLGDNGYGDFEITSNTWTYTLNNGHAAVQALDAGETLTDTHTFTASDGSTQTVTVTINGAEDAPVIGGVATGTVAEDGTLTASDTLTITDADTSDNPISFSNVTATLGDNGYGDFEITSNTWTYTLNNGHAAVQALDAGQTLTDTYAFTASDGSTQTVTVTINGAEDAPVIGGVATGTVAEDGTLTASDTLTITDADTSDNPISFNNVAATLGDNGYGDFEITGNTWTYTLNNGHAAVQALDAGESLNDTYTFTASDGSTQTVTVTINGAEDAPVFDSAAVTAATEDAAYSYTITTSDVDVEAVTITAPTLPGWLTFVDNGDGTATLSGTPTNAEVGSHNVVLTVSDGTLSSNQNFTIVVGNTNDPAVIGGTDTGSVQEDVSVVANNISTTGTLTISDPDTGESTFQAATINGTYGDLTIDAAGNWTYTADNTQAAIQQLDVSESLTDTLTVTSFDGTTHNVVITINGSEDAAVISGTPTGSVTEDGTLTSSGALTISDTDTSDTPSFADVGVTAGDNGYGTFEMTSGTWTYTLDNNDPAVQALDAGETLSDTHTFTATDGSTQQVTITINGAEDTPVFDSTAVTAATEDVAYSYTITTSDVDVEAVTITAPTLPAWLTFVDNGDGTATLSGTPTNAEVGSHNVVLTVSDGTLSSNQNFTIVVGNTNDPAVIGGTDTGAVQEDVAVVANNISTTGTLTIADPDTGESTFQAETVTGTYGDLTIDAAGNWTYTADNTQAAIQQLDVSESLTDTLTVTSFDGTTHNVVITINGSEDAAVISGTTTGSVTEDGTLTSSGTLTITDTDSSDPTSFVDVAPQAGDNGHGTFEITSNTWTYVLDNNDPAVQALDVGETLTDTYTFTAPDGETQLVTVTINGAEDAAVIGGVASGSVTEDGALTVSDILTITDVDSSDNPVSFNDLLPTLGDNGYGNFEITGNTWTYTLNNTHAAVQGLDVGETLTDTYTFIASDGSPSLVIVTIDGAEDLPILGGVTIGAVSEDGPLVTSNTLTITDTDSNDNPISFNDLLPTLGDNGYGNFEITGNTWIFTLDNAHAAVQGLDAGESLSDSFTFTASDGSTQLVSVTINGAEDAPTLDNAIADQTATQSAAFNFTFAANTFGDLDASDTLTYTATLSDSSPLPAWLSFDGATRTFSGTPGAGDVGAIDIRITADDASSTITDTFTLTVDPFNSLPVIGGADRGALTEDLDVVDGQIAASGALTIVDADAGESSFVAGTINGALGSLTIDASGNWSYSADNSNPEIQALQAGQTITEALTVTTADGSTHEVIVTINGTQEAAPPPVVEPPVVEPPPEEEIPPPEEETKDEGSGGEDEILPEITPLPQGSPTPVPEHDESDPVAADEPEGEVVNFGPAIDKQTPAVAQQPQVLQAQNLEVDSLTLQVSDDEALNEQYELELLNRIDSMHLGMDSDGARQSADDVSVQIVVGSTASLTVGIVSWVLRGGALLASFMSTVPLLNRFDPLPILKTREDEEDVEPDEDDDTGIDEHAKKVDNMFSGKEGEQS